MMALFFNTLQILSESALGLPNLTRKVGVYQTPYELLTGWNEYHNTLVI
jgi:hypothetical protein